MNGLLVWPMLVGFLVALAACIGAMMMARRHLTGDPRDGKRAAIGDWVMAGDAWTAPDSWLTNVTAVSGTITGAALGVAGASGIGVLFVIFGLSAAFAPLAYGALAAQAANESNVTVGTVRGFLLAAGAVLFGAIGELTTMVLFGTSADHLVSLPLALVFPVVAGLVLALYSVRTMVYVLEFQTKSPPAAGGAASPDRSTMRASYLVASPARGSATL
ncbi:MAG: hypothetical protein ACLQFR_07815 [Streptosporangiaceae bacterium]